MLYDANYDEDLLKKRLDAKIVLFEYNNTHPSKKEEKDQILKAFLGKVGNNYIFEPPFHCDYGYNIEIGDNFFANMNLVILDGAKVTIGNNVFIAPNVGIYTAGHPLDVERRNLGLEYAFPINIGNNVWIGGGVSILPGVSIGDNAVIGSGSVVTKDVPANMLAAGNPCKIIREITEKDKERYK